MHVILLSVKLSQLFSLPIIDSVTDLNLILQIATRLKALNAAHWYIPLLEWLALYDGLTQFLEPETPTPEMQLLSALIGIAPTNEILMAYHLVGSLDFLKWRIRFEGEDRWNPTQQSLASYLAEKPGQIPAVWHWESATPAPEIIIDWLFTKIQAPIVQPTLTNGQ